MLKAAVNVPTANAAPQPPPHRRPTQADVAQGDHRLQVLDFWQAKSARPTPLLFFIHGGGWAGGDKKNATDVEAYLSAGISVVSVNYCFTLEAQLARVHPRVTADDPPIYMWYPRPPAVGQDEEDPTHTANFGVKLQEKLSRVGVPCELVYPGAPGVKHPTIPDYVIARFKSGKVACLWESDLRPTVFQPSAFLLSKIASNPLYHDHTSRTNNAPQRSPFPARSAGRRVPCSR